MSMLVPGVSQLAEPEIVKVADFEEDLEAAKAALLAYVTSRDPEKGARLAESLANESELVTMLLEAFVLRLQAHARKYNARIKQMLAWWAEGDNLDARLADMGLERFVLEEGDPNAFPPVPAVMESDPDARLRYYLAPHAPAAGSRLHYQREALTLGGRAKVEISTPEAGKVVVTYTFDEDSFAARVKDANGRQTAPGKVAVTVLSREGDGTPAADLLEAERAHFARDDVKPETDEVTVRAASIIDYQIEAIAYIRRGPDAQLTKAAGEKALAAYADQVHQLGGYVDPNWIEHELFSVGATRVELVKPLAPIAAADHQAPHCSSISLEVRTL
ncbi:baseplate J/gp47 family protein [Pseudomonas aeruginosa]|uniref:baseplate J/gp47 family protein n=1 Tax=Pseudomonas aeruginosa TaxID=287 RepID=UPI00053F176C|nr:baseplate J/gp47 family protein [Pseudomonas aeruginosa]